MVVDKLIKLKSIIQFLLYNTTMLYALFLPVRATDHARTHPSVMGCASYLVPASERPVCYFILYYIRFELNSAIRGTRTTHRA